MYGYGYRYSVRPGYVPFNPLTDIDGLSLYLNKNTNVNTKIAADFVAANSEYLSSASTDFDKVNEDFSFGCWVKNNGTPIASEGVISKWNGTGSQKSFLLFYDTANGFIFRVTNDGATNVSTAAVSITETNWNFVTCVHDSVNDLVKISVNGSAFVTAAFSGGVFDSTQDFQIGTLTSGTASLDGSIDAPFFYDKALTLAEIQALYNSGNGTSHPNLTNYNGNTYAIGQLLDGTTDAFNIDSVLTPLAATTTGEIELYVTPTDATPISNQRLISFAVATNSSEYFIIDNRTDGKCKVTFREGSVNRWVIDTDNVVFSNGLQAKINLIQDGTPTILIDDVEVAQTLTGANQAYWFNDFTVTNGRIGNFNFNSAGEGAFFEGIIQNVKIWSDATQTTQVAEWLMNDVEGANQVDSVGIYDATPIGTPVSTLASVDNTTIATIESSLISWWDLNEQSGTRFDAVTASANDLTDNNTVGYALGKVQDETQSFPKAISLNGTTDAVNIDSVLTPLASTTTGTIEGYYTPVDATPIGNEYLISFGDTDAAEFFAIIMAQTTGKLRVVLKIAGVNVIDLSTDATAFSDGVQTKYKVTQNGINTEIEINDVVVAQTESGSSITEWFNNTTGLDNGRMGCVNNNSGGNANFANGTIQNVKIWSDATQTTLVANYPFDDSYTDIENGYLATAIGTPTFVAGERASELIWNWIDQSSNAFIFQNDTVTKQPLLSANSIDFDGTDDSLELTVTDVFNDTSGVLFFSGYWDNTSADILIASADTSVTNKYLYVSITAGVVSFWWRNGGTATEIQTTNAITNGSFYSFSIQSTGTAYKIILNGVNENLIVASGANDGNWFGDITTSRDNLTLSTLVRTTDLPFSSSLNKIIYSNANLTDSKITQINNFMSNPDN